MPNDMRRYTGGELVAPNDSADVPGAPASALFIGTGGTLKYDTLDHTGARNTITLPNVPDGTEIRLPIYRVWATGTSAASMEVEF
jgi:hypothetical protein